MLVFCSNCHFNYSFVPSKDAYYDVSKAWEEFTAHYKVVKPKTGWMYI